jgi:hypothetical protein
VTDTTPDHRSSRLPDVILIAALGAEGLTIAAVAAGRLTLFSRASGSLYDYFAPTRSAPYLFLLAALPLFLVVIAAAWHGIHRREVSVVAGTMLTGFVLQIFARGLYPYSMAQVIASPTSDSFYVAARETHARDLLRNFGAIAPTLPLHARSNMPGKILLYNALFRWSTDPSRLALAVVALSSLGGLLLYGIVRMCLGRRAALCALLLFQVVPSKLAFLPILNVVSPVFVLLALFLFLIALRPGGAGWSLAVGPVLYLCFGFDPLTLALGLLFLTALWRFPERSPEPRHWLAVVAGVAVSLFAFHAMIRASLGFDALSAFRLVLHDARRFNAGEHRAYALWLLPNLAEFLTMSGTAVSVVVICRALGIPGSGRLKESGIGRILAVSLCITLLVLTVIGIDRGEVGRLWIFLSVVWQIPAAEFCARFARPTALAMIATAVLWQAVVMISRVAFVVP